MSMILVFLASYSGVFLCISMLLCIMYISVVINHRCSPILIMIVMAKKCDLSA